MFGNVRIQGRKHSRARNPWGNVVPGVAEVWSLFPWFRISIWESCRQKTHKAAVANRKKTDGGLEH